MNNDVELVKNELAKRINELEIIVRPVRSQFGEETLEVRITEGHHFASASLQKYMLSDHYFDTIAERLVAMYAQQRFIKKRN